MPDKREYTPDELYADTELLHMIDVLNNNGILLGEEAEQYRRRIELLKGDTHGNK